MTDAKVQKLDINILLDAGAEVSHSLKFMEKADIPIEIKQRLIFIFSQKKLKHIVVNV